MGIDHVEEVLDMVISTLCSSSRTSLATATDLEEEEEEEVEVDSECDRYADEEEKNNTGWDGHVLLTYIAKLYASAVCAAAY